MALWNASQVGSMGFLMDLPMIPEELSMGKRLDGR